MMRKVSKSGVIILPILLVTSVIGVIGFIIQPEADVALAQDPIRNINPIITHIHPQLSVLVNNSPISVPAQIGIDPSLWKDHSLDEYGMQSMPGMNMSAMAPLHTHDNSGIVHVESTANRDYTLGEFLKIWGLNLGGKTVKVTIDGKPLADFEEYILSDGEHIRLEIQ
jgi:hypothetical protein